MKANQFVMAIAMAFASLSASAAPVTLSLGSNTASADGEFGNVRTFTAGGVTVTATAWSQTGDGDRFENANLGQYSTGLGVCNREEYKEEKHKSGTRVKKCDSPEHQVNGDEELDFVLFQFSELVNLLTVTITPAGDYDSDVSYWTGIADSDLTLTGKKTRDLDNLGFGDQVDDSFRRYSGSRSVSLEGSPANSLLFGAQVDSDENDWFKITSISFESKPSQVPEPGSLALVALALGGLGLARRRRAA